MLSTVSRLRSFLSIFLATAALSGVAGCGSSSGESSGPLTKSGFIQHAEAICKRENKEKEAAFSAAANSGQNLKTASRAQVEIFVRAAVLLPFSRAIDDFAKLEPPKRDKATVAAILSSWKAALKRSQADPSKALLGNPFLKGSEAAQAYGIKTCL